MIIKLRVKRTKAKDYKEFGREFLNEAAFNRWYNKQIQDETHYKILDFEILKQLK